MQSTCRYINHLHLETLFKLKFNALTQSELRTPYSKSMDKVCCWLYNNTAVKTKYKPHILPACTKSCPSVWHVTSIQIHPMMDGVLCWGLTWLHAIVTVKTCTAGQCSTYFLFSLITL